ncbi:MAG: cell surface protein [Planctomycetota bacterium]
MQRYLDQAVGVLERFGVLPDGDAPSELTKLLDEVRHVDEPKVLAMAKTVKYMGTFNQMVRDNVADIDVGNRFLQITQMFDSIRADSKRLIAQLDDGKIGLTEQLSNLWMKLRRGTPSDRFEEIAELYKGVAGDTKVQLEREQAIMNGYIDFRFALKESEVIGRELMEKQVPVWEKAKADLGAAQQAVEAAAGQDESAQSRLELKRDEAAHQFQTEDRTYQLLKDIAENLSIGYDVGETLIAKLKQTHDVKDQVYRRSVTFFTTNEHVFTILGAVYTSQHGLHEATQSHEALKEGVNKGLEDVAELGRELERAALKAGYGSTINPASVEKLVTAITDYQVESMKMIAELRKESEANAQEIRRVVEDGKKRYQATLAKFAIDDSAVG